MTWCYYCSWAVEKQSGSFKEVNQLQLIFLVENEEEYYFHHPVNAQPLHAPTVGYMQVFLPDSLVIFQNFFMAD